MPTPSSVAVGAMAVVISVLAGGWMASEVRLQRVHQVSAALPAVRPPGDADRGMRLAHGVGLCAFCHGPELAGAPAVDDFWIGRLYAPNLTAGRGGAARSHSDADFERAIRSGVGRDGRSLLVMPAEHLKRLSAEDLADLIAYLRSAPPRDADWPPTRVGPLTRLALVAGWAPDLLAAEAVDHAARPQPPPTSAVSADYGRYLVAVGSCRVCHRRDLRGGLHPLSLPGEPPPPDLTSLGAVAGWSSADFARAMRTGVRPDGRVLDPRYMPWPHFALLQDYELEAIRLYLLSLPEQT